MSSHPLVEAQTHVIPVGVGRQVVHTEAHGVGRIHGVVDTPQVGVPAPDLGRLTPCRTRPDPHCTCADVKDPVSGLRTTHLSELTTRVNRERRHPQGACTIGTETPNPMIPRVSSHKGRTPATQLRREGVGARSLRVPETQVVEVVPCPGSTGRRENRRRQETSKVWGK